MCVSVIDCVALINPVASIKEIRKIMEANRILKNDTKQKTTNRKVVANERKDNEKRDKQKRNTSGTIHHAREDVKRILSSRLTWAPAASSDEPRETLTTAKGIISEVTGTGRRW